jgi:hypothetical protein
MRDRGALRPDLLLAPLRPSQPTYTNKGLRVTIQYPETADTGNPDLKQYLPAEQVRCYAVPRLHPHAQHV